MHADISAQVAAEEVGELDKKMNASKHSIYHQTDIILSNLFLRWPYFFHQKNSTIYRSANFFNAILQRHRASVKPGLYFWDEIQFYSDIIENFLLWLNYEVDECLSSFYYTENRLIMLVSQPTSSSLITKALKSFSYLVYSLAYLGAEQSLCICFHSLICFSHKETFHYANVTFSAEIMFRTYTQSLKLFIEHKNDQIKKLEYNAVFPELSYCRQEILSGMDNVGVPMGPSVCNQSRRNETNIVDVNQLANKELMFFEDLLYNILSKRVETNEFCFIISTLVFTFSTFYIFIMNLFKVIYFKTRKPKNKRKKKQVRLETSSHETLPNETPSLSLQPANIPQPRQIPPKPPVRLTSNGLVNTPQSQFQPPNHIPQSVVNSSHFNSLSTARNYLSPDVNPSVNFAALKVASV